MQKLPYTLALLLTASLIISSCNRERSVVINGVRWATHNVDVPGTFTRNASDAGGLFTFDEAQNACPQGWRLPTREELQSLVDVESEWTTRNDVNGRFFGAERNRLFLPAVGWWRGGNESLNDMGASGSYWSSTSGGADIGWGFFFSDSDMGMSARWRGSELSVRCVAE